MPSGEFLRKLKKSTAHVGALAAALFFLGVTTCPAQEVTATLYGSVTDPAGAAIPEASVTVTNPATGQSVSAKSRADGTYEVTSLRPAAYTLTVEHPGFEKSVQTGIKLDVNQKARVDVQLQVGAITTTVEVAGTAPLVETATATVGMTVDTRQVTELPLNIRRFGQLPLLMPGTVPDRGGFSAIAFGSPFSEITYAANGARGSGNNFLIDGVDSKNMFTGGFSVQPSPDAVQEFKVQTQSFSAVFGKNAGSTVNLVTRSGTNEIHGSAFEFLRNDKLDARNFFADTRQPFKRNQFGGYIGGPIKKNKTFFFGGYEALRKRKGLTSVLTVPTPKMLTGDFSEVLTGDVSLSPCPKPGAGDPVFDTGAIFDPATVRQITCADGTLVNVADPFDGNIVGSDRFDPVALKVVPFFPQPTAPGIGANYIANPRVRRDDNQYLVKVDHTFSDKDKMFVRYILGRSTTFTPELAYTFLPGFGDKIPYSGQNIALSWSHTLSPTMLNEFRFGFSRNQDVGVCEHCPRAQGFMESFGIAGLHALRPQDEGFPFFGFSQGYAGIGDANYRPVESNDMVEKYNDTLTIIRGKHTLAVGVDIQPYQSLRDQAPFSPHGQFAYGGLYTNHTIADFLLGLPNSAGRSVTEGVNYHDGKFWNAFAQEDYRATRNLTINVGLRWEYHQLPTDRRNVGAALFRIPGAGLFKPGNAILVIPDYAQADAVCNSSPRYINDEGDHLVACSSDMKKYGFTGRAARSLWFPDRFNWAPRIGFAWRPTSSDRFVIRAGYGMFFDLSEFNAFHYGFNNPVHGISQFNNVESGLFVKPPITTASAFTTATVPALKDSFISINVDPHFRQPYIHEWNFDIESQLASNMALEVRYLGSSAIEMSHFHFFGNQAVPGPGDIQPRRLYPDFGFTAEAGSGANANYNSLQLQLTRKMSHGLSFMAGYTWAKQITNNEGEEGGYSDGGAPLGQDDNHQGAERALGINDVRHRFTFSSIYELPFGLGKRWANQTGLVNGLVGGWELTVIMSWQTGFPNTPAAGFDAANVGTGVARPDRLCNGNLPDGKRTVEHWFDTSCFTDDFLTADFNSGHPRFGNSGRSVIEGPGYQNWDFGLLKDFHLSERFKLQFRAEFFNSFNQAAFADFGPENSYSRLNTNVSSPAFGRIGAAGEPRDIQFGLKFLW